MVSNSKRKSDKGPACHYVPLRKEEKPLQGKSFGQSGFPAVSMMIKQLVSSYLEVLIEVILCLTRVLSGGVHSKLATGVEPRVLPEGG